MFDAYSSTTTAPTYQTNQVNSLPAISRTAGTGRYVIPAPSGSALDIIGDMTIIAVINPASSNTATSGMHTIFSRRDASTGNPIVYELSIQGTVGGILNGSNPDLIGGLALCTSGASGFSCTGSTSALTMAAWQIVAVKIAGSTVTFYSNGTAIGSETIAAGKRPTSSTSINNTIFGIENDDSFNLYRGYLAELTVYNVSLSSGSQNSLECYLSAKYSIAIGHGC